MSPHLHFQMVNEATGPYSSPPPILPFKESLATRGHTVSWPSEQLPVKALQCRAVNNQHKHVTGGNLQTPTHLMLIGKHRLPDSK